MPITESCALVSRTQ